MSADQIIEGLKQGNAVDLELIKKLKEGLDFITDGMQRECYNHSHALSELRESLAKESANLNVGMTAAKKAEIQNFINDSIQSIRVNRNVDESIIQDELGKAAAALEKQTKVYNDAANAWEQLRLSLERIIPVLTELKHSEMTVAAVGVLVDEHLKNIESLRSLRGVLKEQQAEARRVMGERQGRAWTALRALNGNARRNARALESIAIALDIPTESIDDISRQIVYV